MRTGGRTISHLPVPFRTYAVRPGMCRALATEYRQHTCVVVVVVVRVVCVVVGNHR